jgi:hypothetical protein
MYVYNNKFSWLYSKTAVTRFTCNQPSIIEQKQDMHTDKDINYELLTNCKTEVMTSS